MKNLYIGHAQTEHSNPCLPNGFLPSGPKVYQLRYAPSAKSLRKGRPSIRWAIRLKSSPSGRNVSFRSRLWKQPDTLFSR